MDLCVWCGVDQDLTEHIPLCDRPEGTGPPELPKGHSGGGCPRIMAFSGATCGELLAYAHTVREYRVVHSWTSGRLVVGQTNDIDGTNEPASLFCTAGHEWAVPHRVEFE